MKVNYILNSPFNKIVSWFFVAIAMLISLPELNAQITRTQILNNVYGYDTYSFYATSGNIWAKKCSCGNRYVYTPSWVKSGYNTSMPYSWGGFSTMSSFTTDMSNGLSAGDVCSSSGGGCGGLSIQACCASGVDCSGLVSRAWGLSSKYNCSGLAGLSSKYSSMNSVMEGDILVNTNGSVDHVRLVTKNNISATSYIETIESAATGWHVFRSKYTPVVLSGGGYVPMYYNKVITCAPPSSFSVSGIASTSANVYFNTISGISTYYISYRPSTSSTWYTVPVSSSPAYLTGLSSNTTYYYQMASNCGSSTSSYSSQGSFTTTACPTPSGIYSNNVLGTQITFYWSGSASSYYFRLKPKSTTTWWTWPPCSCTGVAISGLSKSTIYDFQVQSICGSSISNWSSSYSVTTRSYKKENDSVFNDTILKVSVGDLSGVKVDGFSKEIGLLVNPMKRDYTYHVNASIISIVSIDGKEIKNYTSNTEDCEILLPFSISPGIYIIRLMRKEVWESHKIIIE
jgi:hypothetical protein